jgi:hypothetical protein
LFNLNKYAIISIMNLPLVPYRPLDVVHEQATLYSTGLPFISLAPQDLGAVPGLFDEEVWAYAQNLNPLSSENGIIDTFETIERGTIEVPRQVLEVAQAIVALEKRMYPELETGRRLLRYLPRIDNPKHENTGAPHIDGHQSFGNQVRGVEALYTAASRDGTVGFSGLNRIGTPHAALIAKPELAIIDKTGATHPTTAGHLHRFDGLHDFPKPHHEGLPPPRLLHLFKVATLIKS